jgi:hypothetical protein
MSFKRGNPAIISMRREILCRDFILHQFTSNFHWCCMKSWSFSHFEGGLAQNIEYTFCLSHLQEYMFHVCPLDIISLLYHSSHSEKKCIYHAFRNSNREQNRGSNSSNKLYYRLRKVLNSHKPIRGTGGQMLVLIVKDVCVKSVYVRRLCFLH